MNVVEPRHGGGTYVTSLDPRLLARPINFLLQIEPSTFLDLFEVRQVLEVAAARLAAPKITDEMVDSLEQLAHAAAAAVRQPARYSELDSELAHQGDRGDWQPHLPEPLRKHLRPAARKPAPDGAGTSCPQPGPRRPHGHRCRAARRDPDAAAQAMQDHLENLRQVLEDMFGEEERAPGQKERS